MFPAFKEKNEKGEVVEAKKNFTFQVLQPVAECEGGYAFGELALLNDKPRSATVMTLEDTHFAILEKDDFKKIMAKSLRNKFAAQVSFLSKFPFLSGMTRITKEKLGYLMKKTKYTHGQVILSEGEDVKSLYLIESGEFEINKKVFLEKKRDSTLAYYLRSVSFNKNDSLHKILTSKSQILFSSNNAELHYYLSGLKMLPKKTLRISILGQYECFGITDCVIGSPYSSVTVKCHSREAIVHKIDKFEFFKRIKHNTTSMNKVVRHKMNFIAERMLSLFEILKFTVPPQYQQNPLDCSFEEDTSDGSQNDDEASQESEEVGHNFTYFRTQRRK